MDLFPPLALRAFGQRWFERGSLFRNATIDREPVSASCLTPPSGATDAQVDCWVHREDGLLVAEGTLAVGDPAAPTALQRIPMHEISPEGSRILANIRAGDMIEPMGVVYSTANHDERNGIITEMLTWYEGPSPWGERVASPAGTVQVLYGPPVASLREKIKDAVGLFGAIELRNINGPMLVDTPYSVAGEVLAVGQSPKTEFFWFETIASDSTGKEVAAMRMLLRFMKASLPAYAQV